MIQRPLVCVRFVNCLLYIHMIHDTEKATLFSIFTMHMQQNKTLVVPRRVTH